MRRNRQYRRVEPVMKPEERGSASERGYGHRWRTYSVRFLVENPFCIYCGAESRLTDHIIPVTQDGSESSGIADELFFEPWNHQPLCFRDHRTKTDGHDNRLASIRKILLEGLEAVSGDDDNARRNELLHRASLWPRWYDLESGEVVTLRVGKPKAESGKQ